MGDKMKDRLPSLRTLLWIDTTAAALAGMGTLLLRHILSDLFQLPVDVLTAQAVITLLYSLYSFALARQKGFSKRKIKVLALGNITYSFSALGLIVMYASSLTPIGIAYLFGEFLFVCGLGLVEIRKVRTIR